MSENIDLSSLSFCPNCLTKPIQAIVEYSGSEYKSVGCIDCNLWAHANRDEWDRALEQWENRVYMTSNMATVIQVIQRELKGLAAFVAFQENFSRVS
jgi:hypothetical protein